MEIKRPDFEHKKSLKTQNKNLLDELKKNDLSKFYTWEIIKKDGTEYELLDNEKVGELFNNENNIQRGRKTTPTKIRKAIPWEIIPTYVKNENWEYVKEGEITAQEWDFVFQNINDEKDTYIPQNFDINEYAPKNKWDEIEEEYKLFIRKSKPSKLLHEVIQKPTIIIVKKWNNYEQALDVGSTLKLDWDEVTWINKWGFEAWSITDKEGNIL